MKLKRIYRTKLTTDDLYRNIRRNMSPEPGFSGNDFTYFAEFNKALETTKSLWFSIPYEHKVNVKSNSMFFWPRTTVTFEPIESGTIVTVHFTGTTLAYILYGTFVAAFLSLMGYFLIRNPSDLSPVLATLVFSIPLAIIPFLLRKTQNNLIGRLEYS
ncbi:hypothetical protein FNH22_03670 [Fulvivirga sp. M361]|uniref:hypothetical protein n=1 Tax=Fulvivirga sp. M361 TaxID=2594266 RepID=UPI00117BC203|nr:hypothetical protein [Fulvivirga sp. M361]TRX61882.1 hypothetical protein FNH22_03670 [Fulvivirga sp. M361]